MYPVEAVKVDQSLGFEVAISDVVANADANITRRIQRVCNLSKTYVSRLSRACFTYNKSSVSAAMSIRSFACLCRARGRGASLSSLHYFPGIYKFCTDLIIFDREREDNLYVSFAAQQPSVLEVAIREVAVSSS